MDFFTFAEEEAKARATDPQTSHAAAASVKNLTRSREPLLAVIKGNGGGTDEMILGQYEDVFGNAHPQSPSGLRTRRAELVRAGLVEDSGERRTLRSGRQAIVWKAV